MDHGDVDAVWDVLRHHVGRAQAISRSALRHILGWSDRRLRRAIHELVAERQYPVASSPDGGYYRPANTEEVRQAVDYYRRYGQECYERADGLERAARRWVAHQTGLFGPTGGMGGGEGA